MTRIAIVTPYYKEPKTELERCLASVARQSLSADHILIADGHPQTWLEALPLRHLALDRNHANFGNTPRAVGALLAIGEGYDAVGFLDADNWLEPDHLEHCLEAAEESGAPQEIDYVLAKRTLRRPDGQALAISADAAYFKADTNCLLFFPGAYHLLPIWGTMPAEVAPIGDRMLYRAIQAAKLRVAETQRETVNYVTDYAGAYLMAGESPPADAKGIDFEGIVRWMNGLGRREREIAERCSGAPFTK
ncbi:MAG: glycosyltransferase [Rhodovibrionaceae bacterium]